MFHRSFQIVHSLRRSGSRSGWIVWNDHFLGTIIIRKQSTYLITIAPPPQHARMIRNFYVRTFGLRRLSLSKCLSVDSTKDKLTSIDDKTVKTSEPSNIKRKQIPDELEPLELNTKDGKLVVTPISSTIGNIVDNSNTQKTIDINTKNGKLRLTTTLKDSQPVSVVLEKENNATIVDNVKLTDEETEKLKIDKKDEEQRNRVRVDFNRTSLERNFITPGRAMSDFLLKASDLENLSKTKRRSPYEQEPPITVYWRKDVENKAIEVWGSRDNILREYLRREIEKKMHHQNIFTVKRRLRDYRREVGSRAGVTEPESGLKTRSGRVVLTAIGINSTNFVFKLCACLFTGSHSMFAESMHSLCDTVNQLILAYGLWKSDQIADRDHPYGYKNMSYVTSLISGVGIFCVGAGLSFYHGIGGLMNPAPVGDFFWAFCILGGALISEGATLLVAINSIKHSAKKNNIPFREYVMRGQDPSVNVVLFEDSAAVLSVLLAGGCMGLSTYTGSSIPDAVGSLLVGGILGCVASFIIYSNVTALVGRSIPEERLEKINAEIESDVMIRAIHDVKGIDMGSSLVRYKAEMDFDGRELARFYLDKQDLNQLLQEVKQFQNIDELETFLLKHGESIVDLMGGEIDRIEMKLRKKFPEIRHCDLEIL